MEYNPLGISFFILLHPLILISYIFLFNYIFFLVVSFELHISQASK